MICQHCHKQAREPQYIWAIDVGSPKCRAVVKGAIVACQGPECAGNVLDAVDAICDKAKRDGKRWMLMDCAATKANRTRLMQNYDWTTNGADIPAEVV